MKTIFTHLSRIQVSFKLSLPPQKDPRQTARVSVVPEGDAYLHLDHEASLPPEFDHVAVDVHPVLRLQALQHGVDADVGARAADTGAESTGGRSECKAKGVTPGKPRGPLLTDTPPKPVQRGGWPGRHVRAPLTCSAPRWGH